MRRTANLMFAAVMLSFAGTHTSVAKGPVPGLVGGGSVSLADVLEVAKPYPNLVLQVRLQLVRANVKREQVVCSGARYSPTWINLGGARLAPYACKIGKRTLVVDAAQNYFDRNGRKLKIDDPEVMRKAAKVTEKGLTWSWK